MTTDRKSREELRRMEAAATSGEWGAWNASTHGGGTYITCHGEDETFGIVPGKHGNAAWEQADRDAQFIAAMRNALPALLDAADRADVEAARREAAEAKVARGLVLAEQWRHDGFDMEADMLAEALAEPTEGGEG